MANLVPWLQRYFRAHRISKCEFSFPCPKCFHTQHYWNVDKEVGYCHRASCHATATLEDLIEICGVAPDDMVVTAYGELRPSEEPLSPLCLPTQCRPLVWMDDGQYMTNYPSALGHVLQDRHLTIEQVDRWELQRMNADNRIVVPIYEDGYLISYVNRAGWWNNAYTIPMRKYSYPKGYPVHEYFLGWDEAQTWKELVLVENTFNAIWLRDEFCATTTFGSQLSDAQVEKLNNSKVKKVIFLWDHGASTEKARAKLSKIGLQTAQVELGALKKQPDEWRVEDLVKMVETA